MKLNSYTGSMTRKMSKSDRNYSLDKAKIKFLLLEGIHPRARKVLEEAGYTNIIETHGALTPQALKEAFRRISV